ncbi:MAG: non-canonical purine NTP pyrophosphatase, partial [Woeseiaceae bacterium]|nr:non-canonical purine NTP pyrophosphatase [Woeseiaceae bacterium]
SGLAVNALDGRPGVYSARYAGVAATDDDNIDKLLAEMADVDDAARGAAFHCVMSLVMPDETEAVVATGVWHGSILRARSGSGGFGYDPVFLDPASGLSAAALTPAQKSARSHRGKALRAMLPLLRRSLS